MGDSILSASARDAELNELKAKLRPCIKVMGLDALDAEVDYDEALESILNLIVEALYEGPQDFLRQIVHDPEKLANLDVRFAVDDHLITCYPEHEDDAVVKYLRKQQQEKYISQDMPQGPYGHHFAHQGKVHVSMRAECAVENGELKIFDDRKIKKTIRHEFLHEEEYSQEPEFVAHYILDLFHNDMLYALLESSPNGRIEYENYYESRPNPFTEEFQARYAGAKKFLLDNVSPDIGALLKEALPTYFEDYLAQQSEKLLPYSSMRHLPEDSGICAATPNQNALDKAATAAANQYLAVCMDVVRQAYAGSGLARRPSAVTDMIERLVLNSDFYILRPQGYGNSENLAARGTDAYAYSNRHPQEALVRYVDAETFYFNPNEESFFRQGQRNPLTAMLLPNISQYFYQEIEGYQSISEDVQRQSAAKGHIETGLLSQAMRVFLQEENLQGEVNRIAEGNDEWQVVTVDNVSFDQLEDFLSIFGFDFHDMEWQSSLSQADHLRQGQALFNVEQTGATASVTIVQSPVIWCEKLLQSSRGQEMEGRGSAISGGDFHDF